MMFKLGKTSPGKSLIAIVSSEQAESEIKKITAKISSIEARIKKTDDTLRDAQTLVNGSADIVIVEADLSDSRSETVLKGLCHYVSHDGAMMVISDNPTAAQMRMLFKTGVNDVLSLPLNEQDFINSIETAVSDPQRLSSNVKSGRVITMMKCAGGVGATTLATNLAHQFMKSAHKSRHKKTAPDASVAILDLDVQFGSVAINLDLKNKPNILDIMQAELRLDSALLASTIQRHSSGLNILSSPEDIIPYTAFDAKFFETLIQLSRSMFEYTFIDMPSAWTNWTHAVVAESDLIVPIMKPSVAHAHNGVKLINGLDHLEVNASKTLMVMNQVGKGLAYRERVSQTSKLIERPLVTVREDISLHKTARDRGEILANLHGSNATVKDLNQVSAKMWQKLMQGHDDLPEQIPSHGGYTDQRELGA